MKVAITGATGFIGRPLCQQLITSGHEVIALTRDVRRARERLPEGGRAIAWGSGEPTSSQAEIAGCDAVINLAGENLSAGRWTPARREALLQSRLDAIRSLAEVISRDGSRVTTLIQGSAVGFYGPRGDEELTESDATGGGYLAEISRRCEEEARALDRPGLRVVLIRTGIVLGREGGIVPRLMTPLQLGVGGFPGNGRQWLSWIDIEDEVRAITHLLDHEGLEGAFNLTAPEPLTMKSFMHEAGRLLKRPVWAPLPAFMLRIVFGEMADEALLVGQRVLPSRLIDAGFQFTHPTVESTIRHLYSL